MKNGNNILEYTYDQVGNITSVKKNGTIIEQYTYDALNQLVSATYGGNTYTYSYDHGGNLTEIKKNGETIKTYTYGNSEWTDQLTGFNGQVITYDEIGNPLIYRNGINFTWQNGRQLAGVTQNGSPLASYTYNADGLRNSKTVNGITTEYYWQNGTLYGQKSGDESIFYLYDENGSVYGFIYKNLTEQSYYYYEFNLQGDIIGIIDSTGTRVVEYSYGAWGDILSITGTLADTIGQKNPLRYRGYYYDAETGFYYVASRYYDPEIGRWLNADGYVSTGQGVLGNNMFAYCGNNPINRVDPTGHFWSSVLDFVKTAITEIGNFFVASAPAYAGVGGIALVDGALPFGDTIAAIGALAITANTIVQGINQTIKVKSVAKEKEETKVVTKTQTSSSSTPIYRYGGTNPGNLIPTRNDTLLNSGLSFSTVPKPGAAMTTVEAINSTGVLIAIQDGPTHVSVYPIGTTVAGWRMAGTDSIWTQALKSIVIKWY